MSNRKRTPAAMLIPETKKKGPIAAAAAAAAEEEEEEPMMVAEKEIKTGGPGIKTGRPGIKTGRPGIKTVGSVAPLSVATSSAEAAAAAAASAASEGAMASVSEEDLQEESIIDSIKETSYFQRICLSGSPDSRCIGIAIEILKKQLINTRFLRKAESLRFQTDLISGNGNVIVRTQGLFDYDEISKLTQDIIYSKTPTQLDQINLLCKGNTRKSDNNYKFALKSKEGTPNRVLAMSLFNALKYLNEIPLPSFTTSNIKDDLEYIFYISNSERGNEDTKRANKILNAFIIQITSSKLSPQEKLIEILKVYGPLLDKGLSDSAQFGELSKLCILKIMEKKLIPGFEEEVFIENDPELFWKTTSGFANLLYFSSDAIAGTLATLFEILLYYLGHIIIPRKANIGRYTVMCLNYRDISLMRILDALKYTDSLEYLRKNGSFSETMDPGIVVQMIDIVREIRATFLKEMGDSVSVASQNIYISLELIGILNNAFINPLFFSSLRSIVDNIYRIDRKKTHQTQDFFAKNLLQIIDDINNLYTQDQLSDVSKELLEVVHTFGIFDIVAKNTIPGILTKETMIVTVKYSLNIIKGILIGFGKMIVRLNTFVNTHEKNLQDMIPNDGIYEYEMSSESGIIDLTKDYYEGCSKIKNLTLDKLLAKLLEIATGEETCAEQDTDFGHDQAKTSAVQTLGSIVASEQFCDKDDKVLRKYLKDKLKAKKSSVSSVELVASATKLPSKREAKQTAPMVEEEKRITEQMFTTEFLKRQNISVVGQIYKDKKPLLYAKGSADPSLILLYNTEFYVSAPTELVNNILPIGPASNIGAIDIIQGNANILVSREFSGNAHKMDYAEIEDILSRLNIIAFQGVSLLFDGAAAAKVVNCTNGKETCSFRFIYIKEGRVTKTLIFTILTVNLNPNANGSTLSLDFSKFLKSILPINLADETPYGNSVGEIQPVDTITKKELFLSMFFNVLNTETQKIALGAETMKKLLTKCYNIPDIRLKEILEKILTTYLITELNQLNSNRVIAEQNYSSKTTISKASSYFKKNSFLIFIKILKEIHQYYKINKPEKDVEIGHLLDLIAECMFGMKYNSSFSISNRDSFQHKIDVYNFALSISDRLIAAFSLLDLPDSSLSTESSSTVMTHEDTPGAMATDMGKSGFEDIMYAAASLPTYTPTSTMRRNDTVSSVSSVTSDTHEEMLYKEKIREEALNYILSTFSVINDSYTDREVADLIYKKVERSPLFRFEQPIQNLDINKQIQRINFYIDKRRKNLEEYKLLRKKMDMGGGSIHSKNKKPRKTVKKQKHKLTKRRNRKIKGRKTRHKSKIQNKRHTRNNR